MKIGLDISQTCAETAGCGLIAKELARTFSKLASSEREIILYHHFGNWINADTKHGFNSNTHHVSSPLLNTTPTEAQQIWNDIETGNSELPGTPDIVHSHNFSSPNTGKVPLVVTVHDLAFWDMPEATTETNRIICQDGILNALKQADAFIFPSKFSQDRFLHFFKDIVEKRGQSHTVVPWAGRFETDEVPKRYSTAAPWLFVGSLEPRKNVSNILQAYELYWSKSKQKRRFLFAGPQGWKTQKEISHIASLTKRGWVDHLGYLNDTELEMLYRQAFALVWPSHYEGFGLPLLESMSKGTPVITSNKTSLPEVGGDAAIYCDPNSVISIASCMLELEENQSDYSHISQRSLNRSNAFSWEKSVDNLINFYQKILSDKSTEVY